ncbi:MAG: DUF58 domain-containing protein [Clostridiales bacterium]|nr:DUF58 domain-containing protein [Clostridiales bacterium]
MTIFWIIALAALVALIQATLFSTFNLKALSYERRFSRPAVQEGEAVELVEVIRNRKVLPVPWLRVESRISPSLRFGGAAGEREIDFEQYHRSVFYLSPLCQITRRHEVTCLKRGYYPVGSVALTAGDLFALSLTHAQKACDCAITVYPRPLADDEVDAPSSRWQGELAVKRWILPDPFLVAGIRDGRAGDPMRDVHWRLTARTGRLQVKVRDFTADPRAMVILNVQTSEEQWGELMDYEQDGIERGIRLAATLCLRALRSGVEAGFAANGCPWGRKGSGVATFVPPRRSFDQAEAILTAMARLTLHREVTFPTFLENLPPMRGVDILLISCYDSPAIQRQVRRLREAGCSVTLIGIQPGTASI